MLGRKSSSSVLRGGRAQYLMWWGGVRGAKRIFVETMKKAFLVSRLHFCLEHAQRKQANPKLDSRCGVRLTRNKPTCLSSIGRPASADKNQTLPHILQLLDARQSPSYLKSTEHTLAAVHRTLGTGSNVARKKAKYLSPMADAHWRSTAKHPPSGNFSLWAAFITCAKRGIAARAGHLEADAVPCV